MHRVCVLHAVSWMGYMLVCVGYSLSYSRGFSWYLCDVRRWIRTPRRWMDDSTRETRAGTTTTTVDGARARDDPARVRVRVVVVVGEGGGDVRDVETRVVDDALDATDGVGDDDDARVVRARARARRRRRGNSRRQVARARASSAKARSASRERDSGGDERRARRETRGTRVRGCRGDDGARERERRERKRDGGGVRGRGGECGDALGRTGRDVDVRARGETETRGDGARAKRWSVCRCGGDGAIERGDGGVSCGRARDERWKRGEFDGGEDAVGVAVGVDVDGDHARRGQSAVARTIRG